MARRTDAPTITQQARRRCNGSRAWAVENRLVLAQLATEEKSNEITAIPLLLQQLARACCIVTIDAMGTQTKIAQQIIAQEGEYALALKDNQGSLYDEVQATFRMVEQEAFTTISSESDCTVLLSAWAFGNQRGLDDQ
jgi:predicted transposase YbfD/YdcC